MSSVMSPTGADRARFMGSPGEHAAMIYVGRLPTFLINACGIV